MMGTWLPETCWATIRREIKNTKVTSSWFFLSTLNYDARSTSHQVHKRWYTYICIYLTVHVCGYVQAVTTVTSFMPGCSVPARCGTVVSWRLQLAPLVITPLFVMASLFPRPAIFFHGWSPWLQTAVAWPSSPSCWSSTSFCSTGCSLSFCTFVQHRVLLKSLEVFLYRVIISSVHRSILQGTSEVYFSHEFYGASPPLMWSFLCRVIQAVR